MFLHASWSTDSSREGKHMVHLNSYFRVSAKMAIFDLRPPRSEARTLGPSLIQLYHGRVHWVVGRAPVWESQYLTHSRCSVNTCEIEAHRSLCTSFIFFYVCLSSGFSRGHSKERFHSSCQHHRGCKTWKCSMKNYHHL